MYEVEFKVELTSEEREGLLNSFKEQSILSKGVTPQADYYIEAKPSPYGGNDLKRYRNENGVFIYTEKIWEVIDGQPFRKENEHEVSREEFESKIVEFPNAIKIKKDREWFDWSYQGTPIDLSIDSIKFDHSPAVRHFIEAEICVEDKKDVVKTKELICESLKHLLNKSEIVESPGMFSMAFKRL